MNRVLIFFILLCLIVIFLFFSNEISNFTDGYKNLTIVTAYFKIPRTRSFEYTQGRENMPEDSDGMYKEWMKGLLSYKGPMVIYTDDESYDYIQELRKNNKKTKIIKTSLEKLEAYKYFKNNKQNNNKYPTMVWHEHNNFEINKKLYTLWNSKFSLLKQSVEKNYFNTNYFAWFDIGYIREPDKKLDYSWPDEKKLKILDDKVIFNIVYGGPTCDEGGSVSGAFIGCNTKNIYKVHELFINELKRRYKENIFAGNDQELYQEIRCKHPELIQGIKGLDTDYWDHVEGKWFYMIPYFYNKIYKIKEEFTNFISQ